MRLQVFCLLFLFGLSVGLPRPEDEAEEDEVELDEYDVYDALEDAAEDENGFKFGLGIIEPDEEDKVDEDSVGYFDKLDDEELVGAQRSDSYSSVKLGYVSSVKNQGKCGSCAAFSAIAAFEICYKKITGESIDFSEQHLVDCGYKFAGAKGCIGAPQHAYMDFLQQKKNVTGEKNYPYQGQKSKLKCPKAGSKFLTPLNTGARVATAYWTYNGTEELMRKLVFLHGAVLATLTANGPLAKYTGGIFDGCPPGTKVDHAVTVVGYGREKGVDFWLIKNSWGPKWGEKGYFRLKRGVGMCSIGKSFSAIDCEALATCSDGDSECENDEQDAASHEDEHDDQE